MHSFNPTFILKSFLNFSGFNLWQVTRIRHKVSNVFINYTLPWCKFIHVSHNNFRRMIQFDPSERSFLFMGFRIKWSRYVYWVFYNTWSIKSTRGCKLLFNNFLNFPGLGRKNFFRDFLTKFLRTRIRRFINNNIYCFHYLYGSFVVYPISLSCRRVFQKYSFIASGFKFPNILSILENETSTSKNSKILHIWLPSFP